MLTPINLWMYLGIMILSLEKSVSYSEIKQTDFMTFVVVDPEHLVQKYGEGEESCSLVLKTKDTRIKPNRTDAWVPLISQQKFSRINTFTGLQPQEQHYMFTLENCAKNLLVFPRVLYLTPDALVSHFAGTFHLVEFAESKRNELPTSNSTCDWNYDESSASFSWTLPRIPATVVGLFILLGVLRYRVMKFLRPILRWAMGVHAIDCTSELFVDGGKILTARARSLIDQDRSYRRSMSMSSVSFKPDSPDCSILKSFDEEIRTPVRPKLQAKANKDTCKTDASTQTRFRCNCNGLGNSYDAFTDAVSELFDDCW